MRDEASPPGLGAASSTDVLRIEDLVVSYRGPRTGVMSHGRLRAVDGVSLQIGRGETLGLVGESGSGKSTLGRAILQLIPIESGTVVFEGTDLVRSPSEGRRRLRRHAQMVFQNPLGSLNARMRVGRIVQEPLDVHRIGDRSSRRRRVLELLDQVGLPSDSARRYPH
ncbi:MAG: ATP-binding cassette domain-containing protein, partial [Solirubrobacteraceae bacterium]